MCVCVFVGAAEWWRRDPISVIRQSMVTGAPPNISDTILINGQPGDFLPCSSQGTYVSVYWKSFDRLPRLLKNYCILLDKKVAKFAS